MSTEQHGEIERRLSNLQIVPVVNLPSVEAGLRLAEILVRCNLPVAEVTMRTPYGVEGIAAMKQEFNELLLLAGTVLTIEQAAIARDAGAECVVMPGFYMNVVEYCLSQHTMVIPGTVTPSEVLQCRNIGLRAVKFFPAELAGGVKMVQAIASVFCDMRFMPTGGIGPENVADYLVLKAVFCCGGSWLVPEELMHKGQWQDIENRILNALQLIKNCKN